MWRDAAEDAIGEKSDADAGEEEFSFGMDCNEKRHLIEPRRPLCFFFFFAFFALH